MIPAVNWNENPEDFASESVQMRQADSPTIRRRLGLAFGGDTVHYVGSGFNNALHRVSCRNNGVDVIVRRVLAPVPALSARLKREFRLLQHLNDVAFPFAPRPVRLLSAFEVDECPAFAMTVVPGRVMTLNADEVRGLGAVVGALHRLQAPNWLADHVTSTAPQALAREICARLALNLEHLRPSLSPRHLQRAARLLANLPGRLGGLDWSGTRTALLHGDLREPNVLVASDGSIALVDWEFAAAGDPAFDLMWLFSREGFGALERRLFLEGYGDEPGRGWRERVTVLCDLAVLQLALWAQSCLDDIAAGRNAAFFGPGDCDVFRRQLDQLDETHA